jgi:hypothetical protein
MKDKIIEKLHEIEEIEDIEILYACEAGSRVWGFSNDESDYDVRFIYKHRNVKDYLSLKKSNGVIKCEIGELDIVGWDLKKALSLHFKDNPNLREWFLSGEVYIDKGVESIFSGLGGFNIGVLKNHYSAIALKHWRKYCSLEFKGEKTKKYLYVIRSILCWKLLNRDIYPPINIYDLLEHEYTNLNDDIKKAIEDLIDYHQGKSELSEKTILKLNYFIMDSLAFMKKTKVKSFKDIDDYDERFRELLLVCS